MITTKNINQAIKFLTLIRNSSSLMELINSKELIEDFYKIINKELDVKSGNSIGQAKYFAFTQLLSNPEYFEKLLNGEEISSEITLDFVLGKLYALMQEYSETKFDEELNIEGNK